MHGKQDLKAMREWNMTEERRYFKTRHDVEVTIKNRSCTGEEETPWTY
jgi:hypothetical protein